MTTKTSVATAIATSLAAAASIGALGYYIGRDTTSSEISQLKRELALIQSAHGTRNALDYLSDLSAYNDNLFRFSEHAEELAQKDSQIAEMTETISVLEQSNDQLQGQLSQASEVRQNFQKQISDLRARLAIKYKLRESTSLSVGESYSFMGGAIRVGLQNTYSHRAVITLQNETEFIDIGEGVEVQVDSGRCIVALSSTTANGNAVFDLTCRAVLPN